MLLRILELGAGVLRRFGLGALVDRVAVRSAPALGAFRVEIDGLQLRGNHIGQLYYVRELLNSDRERTFLNLLTSAVGRGATVIEAGAHVGYVTLQAARAAGPEGRVITFEPNPLTAPLVLENMAANGFEDRVTVVQMALSDAVGRSTFHLSGGGDTSSLYQPDGADELVEVEVTSLDDWLDPSLLVDVVKLDIEGAEVAAVRGMVRTLERAGAGLVVFVECNPAMLGRAGTSVDELVTLLRAQGLDPRWIDEERQTTGRIEDVDWAHGYRNLYCPRISAAHTPVGAGPR